MSANRTASENTTQRETSVPPWRYLVARRHPWRRQLFLKGRNLTVWQLLGSIRVNHLTNEQAATNFDLPIEAIREAFRYAEENRELLENESARERAMLEE